MTKRVSVVFMRLEQTRIHERRYVKRIARTDFDRALERGWCSIELAERRRPDRARSSGGCKAAKRLSF